METVTYQGATEKAFHVICGPQNPENEAKKSTS